MTTSREIPFRWLVKRADPSFDKDRRRDIEYEFTERVFLGRPASRGVYTDTREAFDLPVSPYDYGLGGGEEEEEEETPPPADPVTGTLSATESGMDDTAAMTGATAQGITGTLSATEAAGTDTATITGTSGSSNPAPWDGVTAWEIPGLTLTVGKRIATGSLTAASSITTVDWNGTGFNDLVRDATNKIIYVLNDNVTASGYDMRGYGFYVKGDNFVVEDCLFDQNSNPTGSSNLWVGCIHSEQDHPGLVVRYNTFIGDGDLTKNRNCTFIYHTDTQPMLEVHHNWFEKAANDAIDTGGVTNGIHHNYFYGVCYQPGSHGDCITINRTLVATTIEYNHFDLYGDGLFADGSTGAGLNNYVHVTTEGGTNTLGVTSRYNTIKGGAYQAEPDLGANSNAIVFHTEYHLLRNGSPWYTVSRSDGYDGPYDALDISAYGTPTAAKFRWYNKVEVDYDGAGNDRSMTSINPL